MRGSIRKRYTGTWSLILDLGREKDPTTNRSKRKQKWITFRGSKKQAEKKLTELLRSTDTGTFIEPSTTTLLDYVRAWHEKSVVPLRRPETVRTYKTLIDHHLAKAPIGALPLQKVRTSDLEAFYSTVKLAPSSLNVLHAVIRRALKIAVRDGLLVANPAAVEMDRPKAESDDHGDAITHCWSAAEARQVLAAAATVSPQVSAFMALAIDTGGRKSELLGLTWDRVNLEAATIQINRQLEQQCLHLPRWGPLKTKKSRRTVDLGPETVARLKVHKRSQATLKMANRTVYQDDQLVFAKEVEHQQTPSDKLGEPCYALVGRHFVRVTTIAGVKKIKFHGTRHTSATLSLQAGVPIQVVSARLGHAKVSMTLDVYWHALPSMRADAAATLGALLHG